MPRSVNRLTEQRIKGLVTPGMHPDGGGLYLRIARGGTQGWVFRYGLDGKKRDMGLGKAGAISLVQARRAAGAARALCDRGIDPIEARAAEQAAEAHPTAREALKTFGWAADRYFDQHSPHWKSEIHRRQWRNSLDEASAAFGDLPIDKIDTEHVLALIQPIWRTKCETANRLRSRVERVLAWAAVWKHRSSANPAAWSVLKEALPSRSMVAPVKHHSAMPVSDLPVFMRALRARETVSARALEFCILTATRTAETLHGIWHEFDLSSKLWTIPAERMKSKRDHIVPLSDRAIEILVEMAEHRTDGDFVFPSHEIGRPLSNNTLLALLQKTMRRRDCTTHGFRSTFRDWCGDVAGAQRDLAEAALAHVIKDKTERTYRRQTAVELRRPLMQAWADFLR